MVLSSAPEAVEIPDPISKWSTPKKILPIVTNKFKTSSQVLGEESDDSDSPKKKSKRHLGDPLEEQYEGSEDKKAYREEVKDRLSRRPSPLSTESHGSSSEGDRRWVRRGGITGNGDLPLITISQASEGRDSPGQLSSLNSSEEGTPPSSSLSRRRHALIPSVSEQEEDEYVEEPEEDNTMAIEIQDHTHFEPIRDTEANGQQDEINLKLETVEKVRDHAEMKTDTGCTPFRLRHMGKISLADSEYDEYCKKSTLPMEETVQSNKRNFTSGRPKQSPLQRSKAVKGSDSVGSSDSASQKPASPEVKRAKIQRLDTDSL